MNLTQRLRLVALCSVLMVSARANPEFVGVLVSEGTTYVAVRTEDKGSVRWAKIGDVVGAYRALAYDAKAETLVLKKGSAEMRLTLKNSTVQPTPSFPLLEALVKNGNLGLEQEVKNLSTLMERRDKTAAELENALKISPDADRVRDLRRQLSIEAGNAEILLQHLFAMAQNRAKARG